MRTYTLLKANTSWLDLTNRSDERVYMDIIVRGEIFDAIDRNLFEAVALIEARDPEDAFDLDCNPSRVAEKSLLLVDFVNRQPMNVGDVLVDNKTGIYYLCKPRDWNLISCFNYQMPQIAGRQPRLPADFWHRNESGSVRPCNFSRTAS